MNQNPWDVSNWDEVEYDEQGNIIQKEEEIVTKDSNGNVLKNGDSVHVIKDLKVGGSSMVLKQGTVIKGIRLVGSAAEIECKIGKSTLVLRTEFLRKK